MSACELATLSNRLARKKLSTNQCPDISGIYYERASETYSDTDMGENRSGYSPDVYVAKDQLCRKVFGGIEDKSSEYMNSHCSLWYWFGLLSDSRAHFTEKCLARKIELSQIKNSNIDIIFSENDENFKNILFIMKDWGFRCEDGSIIMREYGGVDKISHKRMEIFPTVDGSLVFKIYRRGGVSIPYDILPTKKLYVWDTADSVGIPAGVATTMKLYRWDRVGTGANPYKDCR